jgi:hypothetical protein
MSKHAWITFSVILLISAPAWADAGKIIQDSRDLQKIPQRPADTSQRPTSNPSDLSGTGLPPSSPFFNQPTTNNGNNNNSRQPNLFPENNHGNNNSGPSNAQQATTLNEQALPLFAIHNYKAALPLFQQAYGLNPTNQVIFDNMNSCQSILWVEEGMTYEEFGQYQQAINNYEAALRILPSNQQNYIKQTEERLGKARFVLSIREPKPPVSNNPTVVETRHLPNATGLPTQIVAQIPTTPAGNRVRKGFQAITAHDWNAAHAWFADALNHEPSNLGLKRLVDLSNYMATHHINLTAREALVSWAPIQSSSEWQPFYDSISKSIADPTLTQHSPDHIVVPSPCPGAAACKKPISKPTLTQHDYDLNSSSGTIPTVPPNNGLPPSPGIPHYYVPPRGLVPR